LAEIFLGAEMMDHEGGYFFGGGCFNKRPHLMNYFDKAQGSPEDYISNGLPSFRNVNVE
jgi:hypothetical protein